MHARGIIVILPMDVVFSVRYQLMIGMRAPTITAILQRVALFMCPLFAIVVTNVQSARAINAMEIAPTHQLIATIRMFAPPIHARIALEYARINLSTIAAKKTPTVRNAIRSV